MAGLKIAGELSPSHHLLDITNAMVETGVITWISPTKCSKRDDEVQANIKPAASTLQVEQSTLKLAQVPVVANTDTGTELKMQWALQRRGVAMDQCRLLDWSIHEDWVQWLLQSLTREVPSGFSSVRLEQIVRADKELWTILAQQPSKSLKPVNDQPVLNRDFIALTTDPRVTMFVLPLPTARQHQTPPPPKKTDAPTPQPKNNAGNKRRKLSRAEKNCPAELKQFNLKLENKGNICWAFNLSGGCSNAATGSPAKCSRGYHVCAHCHKPGHSLATCRSKPSSQEAIVQDDKRRLTETTQGSSEPEPSTSACMEINVEQQHFVHPPPLRFHKLLLDELLVVEICAGSARLTKTCRKMGLRGLAVDHTKDRSCGTDIFLVDLTVATNLQLLLDIISAERDKLLLVFIAPPCGTASKARCRPIKTSLLRGRKAPVPLRTEAQPDGKDGLGHTDKVKTELANQLYDSIATIVLFCARFRCLCGHREPKEQSILAHIVHSKVSHGCARFLDRLP